MIIILNRPITLKNLNSNMVNDDRYNTQTKTP